MLLLTTLLTLLCFNYVVNDLSYRFESNYLLFWTGILSTASVVFTSVILSSLHTTSFAQLFSQINAMDLDSQMNFIIDFPAFRRQFLKYLYIICVSCLMPVSVIVARPPNWANFMVMSTFLSLRILSVLNVLHVLFYITLYDFMLKSFVQYVDGRGTNSMMDVTLHIGGARPQFLKTELNYYQMLHYELWKIGKTIKRIFGWTLTVILFQNFFYGLFCVYYALLVMGKRGICYEMLRKFDLRLRPETLVGYDFTNRFWIFWKELNERISNQRYRGIRLTPAFIYLSLIRTIDQFRGHDSIDDNSDQRMPLLHPFGKFEFWNKSSEDFTFFTNLFRDIFQNRKLIW